jgi:hypothetical protein
MILSLNEIKSRAIAFSHEWKDETRENAEAQTFWNDFFNIFGVNRRRVASFEKPGIKFDGERGRIDLFWKGVLIVEHKSAGSDLEKAQDQARDYFAGFSDSELPKYVIVSDFKRFRIWDLDKGWDRTFGLEDLVQNIQLFDFMSGHEIVEVEELDPVNIKAAELMGKLHDSLKENGYVGHDLEILLVRLMFCLFADHTLIFDKKGQFTNYIKTRTNEDGSDLGSKLIDIFQTLNTPQEQRQKNLDEDLATLTYIDGSLFQERISIPSFDKKTRDCLLECCHFKWSAVSPAIFGSMFQSVMDQEHRHDFGAHYTSEKNILKTVNALFMDDLRAEFESHKNNKRYLEELLIRIGKMNILDPACGCGNFLIISYRELRRLQIQIHSRLRHLEGKDGQHVLDIHFDRDLDVDSMYGIEIFEFPARIAQVGLWLTDHIVNMELSQEFGEQYKRLPLRTSASIAIKNALRFDWNELVPKEKITYILGNPPFISKQDRSTEQQEDMDIVWNSIDNHGLLDYVSCWYAKASEYIQETKINVAFVSTNAITHGEQVGVLGNYLKSKNIKINFAHRTFKWTNEASGKAQVFVVIIGFSLEDSAEKYIYDYLHPDSEPRKRKARRINLYLVDYEQVYICNRRKPICDVPEISFGSMPNDEGHLLLTEEEKNTLISANPETEKYIKPLISAKEFLYGKPRYCIWLQDSDLSKIAGIPQIMDRIKKVEEYRKMSDRAATKKLASIPYSFGEIRQPDSEYIFIPLTTSENRRYIPLAFLSKEEIANNTCSLIPNAKLYHFGVLMSAMHMTWVSHVCGRLEGRFRYSNNLVYNNFPWPKEPNQKKIDRVTELAGEVLRVRKEIGSTLAEMYDPLLMPKKLLDVHNKLDAAVDRCYSDKKFNSELERIEFLFELYSEYDTSKLG